METKFNFKSQICTSREQSERLLALGLKPETADMFYDHCKDRIGYTWYLVPKPATLGDKRSIPAWSLDRLMELVPHRFGEYCDYANNFMYYYNIPFDVMEQFRGETRYQYLIDCVEWLIQQGYFSKEYLEER